MNHRSIWLRRISIPRVLPLLALGLLAGAAPAPPAPPPAPGNWVMKFEQEFDGPTLDNNTWVQSLWGKKRMDGELECYDASAVSVSDGHLNLTVRPGSIKGSQYISGLINTGGIAGQTPPGFACQYGYVEARMKLPAGKGIWPAFWMLPTPDPAGNYHDGDGEIDIMEFLGHEVQTDQVHLHHGKVWGKGIDAGVDLSQDFHTYSVDWEPDSLTFYLDGKSIYTVDDPGASPKVPEYLILNLAVGDDKSWPGAPDNNTVFPATMQVDWIHVWQKSP